MSEERKGQRHLDARLPGEADLSVLYQQTEKELPPPSLDAAVLDVARQAVRSRPRLIYFFPSRKWVVPLSLAAALWITLELVLEHGTEMRQISAPVSSELQIESSDETSQWIYREPDTPSEEKVWVQGESTEAQGKEALPGQENERNRLETRTARRFAPASPESDIQAVKPSPPQMLQRKREAEEERADTRAKRTEPQVDTAAEQPSQTPSGEQEIWVSKSAAPQSAPAFLSDAPPAAGAGTAETRKEQALSAKDWLAKIKELRRAGKIAEAEESLKAFKQRYPEYPVGKFLQEQPAALQTPKE